MFAGRKERGWDVGQELTCARQGLSAGMADLDFGHAEEVSHG